MDVSMRSWLWRKDQLQLMIVCNYVLVWVCDAVRGLCEFVHAFSVYYLVSFQSNSMIGLHYAQASIKMDVILCVCVCTCVSV